MHIETMKLQFRYAQNLLAAGLADVDHAESLRSPPGGGNCTNWLAGHLLLSRNGALGLLGQESFLADVVGEAYRRGSAGLGTETDAVDLAVLKAALAPSHEAMLIGLDALSAERLEEPVPTSPFGNPRETVGSLLAGLVFHECYHVGQVGLLRRTLGKPGIIR